MGFLVGLPAAVERPEDDEVRAALHDDLPEHQLRAGAGEVAVAGEGVGPHRVGVGVVGRVVVVLAAGPVAPQPEQLLVRGGDELFELTALGDRVDVAVDDPDRDLLGALLALFSDFDGHGETSHPVDAGTGVPSR